MWVGAGALAALGRVVRDAAPAHRVAVVADAGAAALHGARARDALGGDHAPLGGTVWLEVPSGEAHKTRAAWADLTDRMLAAGCGRDTTVVAFGGGVVGDLAGFVAATYLRGVPVVQVPTTLLAMVDASVGGKTAVDTPAGKNLVGAFHPPAAVLVDPALVATLPARDAAAGAVEALKHGLVASAAHFDEAAALLPSLARDPAAVSADALTALVARSVAIKAEVVADDPYERGRRATLNAGHTVGHAVELASGYAMRHGEAVAVGLVVECLIAERLGVAEAGTAARVRAACAGGKLPVGPSPSLEDDAVLAATRSDKKARANRVEYALPAAVGRMARQGDRWTIPVDDAAVRDALRDARRAA